DYIRKYSPLAVREMEKSGIPASITLAQGILESGSGNSTLARRSNNHFGIKCHSTWEGESFNFDDDRENECFRSYKTVEESFRDHTTFLTSSSRYAQLFGYGRDDYKSWAKGLKRAGYATNPDYHNLLIRIIEENKLFLFDSGNTDSGIIAQDELGEIIVSKSNIINAFGREIHNKNRIDYVIARKSDNFRILTDELDLLSWQLGKYNELSNPDKLIEGEIIYIQPKRKHAEKRFGYHIVQENETMYFISQKYGIKLKRLFWINRMPFGSQPGINDKLYLRKRIKKVKSQPKV
ncbi:glucosaminidase domain-containing protein, partial [Bacteroidota bacterium]